MVQKVSDVAYGSGFASVSDIANGSLVAFSRNTFLFDDDRVKVF